MLPFNPAAPAAQPAVEAARRAAQGAAADDDFATAPISSGGSAAGAIHPC